MNLQSASQITLLNLWHISCNLWNHLSDNNFTWMHSSKNSRVKWGSFDDKVSLMDLINMVLLDGMQRPLVSNRCPSIFKSKLDVKAHNKLYAAVLKLGSEEPRFRSAILSRVPGTSLGLIFWWTVTESGCDSSQRVRIWIMLWTVGKRKNRIKA